jgi:hypothetical protein
MHIVREKCSEETWRKYRFPFRLVSEELICQQPSRQRNIAKEIESEADIFCSTHKLNDACQEMARLGDVVERLDANMDLLEIKLRVCDRRHWDRVETIIENAFAMSVEEAGIPGFERH